MDKRNKNQSTESGHSKTCTYICNHRPYYYILSDCCPDIFSYNRQKRKCFADDTFLPHSYSMSAFCINLVRKAYKQMNSKASLSTKTLCRITACIEFYIIKVYIILDLLSCQYPLACMKLSDDDMFQQDAFLSPAYRLCHLLSLLFHYNMPRKYFQDWKCINHHP